MARAWRSASKRDDLTAVHARLYDLHRDFALYRLRLLGHPDCAHAAFADLLEQLVGADDRAGLFQVCGRIDRGNRGRRIQETADPVVRLEQGFDSLAQIHVAPAGLV